MKEASSGEATELLLDSSAAFAYSLGVIKEIAETYPIRCMLGAGYTDFRFFVGTVIG